MNSLCVSVTSCSNCSKVSVVSLSPFLVVLYATHSSTISSACILLQMHCSTTGHQMRYEGNEGEQVKKKGII